MGDTPTDVTGAAIRRARGVDYVVVGIPKMFGGPTTISGLSNALQIPSDIILDSLLSHGANAHVVPELYKVGAPEKVTYPGLKTAQAELKHRAHTYTITGDGRLLVSTDKPYLRWEVNTDKPVVFPMSGGFRSLLATATERRQKEARARAVTPNFEAIDADQKALFFATLKLNNLVGHQPPPGVPPPPPGIRPLPYGEYDRVLQANGAEVEMLEALDGLFGLLLNRPKSSPSRGDRADLVALRGRLERLRQQAHIDLLLQPPDSLVLGLYSLRDQQSREVLDKLREPNFVANARVLIENSDVAPPTALADLCETVAFAYGTLLLTPRAEDVERDITSALHFLSSKVFDTSGLTSTPNPAFNAAVAQAKLGPPADSVLLLLLKLVVQTAPAAGVRVPGPSSLAVAVVEMAGMLHMPTVMRDPPAAGTVGAKLFRALLVSAGLDAPAALPKRMALLKAVQNGDLAAIRRVEWSSRFMSTQGWARALAVAQLLAFYFAITTDDRTTLSEMSKIAGTAGTGAGLAEACLMSFAGYASMVSRGIIYGSAKALGVVGGLAAVVAGTITAYEEVGKGDMTGAWIAGAGAAGGALTVGGYLLAAGAATTATVAGAPAGTVMMVVGGVLIIGTGVAGAVHEALTSGSQRVWVAVLEHLNRDGGPISRTSPQRPLLKVAFDDLFNHRESANGWDVALENARDLKDLGFTVKMIAPIVNESEALVQPYLARVPP